MPSTTIIFDHLRPIDLRLNNSLRGAEFIQKLINELQGANGGITDAQPQRYKAFPNVSGGMTAAYGVLEMASSSGAVGGVLNGVTVTTTWATSDVASCAALATAINTSVNPLVQYILGASSYRGQATLTSVAVGNTINVMGWKFVAVANGITPRPWEFSIGAADANAAANLATAINATPGLNQLVRANTESAATIYFYFLPNRAPVASENISGDATFASLSKPTQVRYCMVYALHPGALGNCYTFTATGTNVSVLHPNPAVGRLFAGSGMNSTFSVADKF